MIFSCCHKDFTEKSPNLRMNALTNYGEKRKNWNQNNNKTKHYSQRRSQGWAEGAQAPPLAIRLLMLIFLVFHQHCTISRDRVHCKMFFGSPTGVATHSLSNHAVMNFRDLRNIEAAFFIPAWLVLLYITRAGCYRALPAWKQAWHLNYQKCRLMCSLYVTKVGPS